MPQLDTSTYASQLFWLAITFGLLYFVMVRTIVPRVGEVIAARKSRIADDLERSEAFHAEAEAARQNYEQAIAEAKADSLKAISSAHEAMEQEEQKTQLEMDKTIRKRLSDADTKLSNLRKETVKEFRTVSVEAAGAMVARLTGDVPEAKAVETEVGKALLG